MRAITFIYKNLPKRFKQVFYSMSGLITVMSSVAYFLSIKDSYITLELVMAIVIPFSIICIAWMFLLMLLETIIHDLSLTSVAFRFRAFSFYILEHGEVSFPEIYEWARNCCEGKYFLGENHILFQKKSDAVMFRMIV